MARVVAFAKTIRNNWKKSLFGAGVLAYGANYAHERYEINELMRAYCAEATRFGNVSEPTTARLKTVLVILNPTANRRSAKKSFDDYCAPILHLAGIAIDIVPTDSEGHARRHLEQLEHVPDAILVAGGDGTLSETITGLLRRNDGASTRTAIGVLPCGRTNTLAQQLFGFSDASTVRQADGLARAAIAVVRGRQSATDVLRIEALDEQAHFRPIFAVGAVQWGAFRDALTRRDKYWYVGPWRDHCAYLFNAFSERLTWNCAAQLRYSPPCAGCSNCYELPGASTPSNVQQTAGQSRRWWSGYSTPKGAAARTPGTVDYSRVQNPECRTAAEVAVQPHELLLRHNAQRAAGEVPRLNVQLNGSGLSGVDFVREGWSRLAGEPTADNASAFEARSVEIWPAEQVLHSEEREAFFSIDNEAYEVKPVRVTVVPNAVRIFAN